MSNPFQTGNPTSIGRGRPSKKIPTPFSRPRIDLDGGSREKRDWQWVNAFDLQVDDIIAGEGIVLEIKTHMQLGAEWRMYLRTPKHEHGTIVEATKKFYAFSVVKDSK